MTRRASWPGVSGVRLVLMNFGAADAVVGLEKEFDVSILTAAIRFCELSSERCCAVFSRKGKVEWIAPSRTWTRAIREGQRVHRDSLAWGFFERGKLDERAQPVPACAWLDVRRAAGFTRSS